MLRVVAFFLPQFHPIPENDAFWGKGFTDWIDVARARPQFEGHNQPNLPADLGFYDLRLVDTLEQQAVLAREHGVHGFCFHYYWFSGRKLLSRPLENLLANKEIDLPFCLNFANENWTRRWDGQEHEILIEQKHSDEDDRLFIRSLIPYFRDRRYIRIEDRPVLLVYKTFLMHDAAKTAGIWRREMAAEGLDLYLVRCESGNPNVAPEAIGYDAAVEFPPHCPDFQPGIDGPQQIACGEGYALNPGDELTRLRPGFRGKLMDYRLTAGYFCRRQLPSHTLFRCVMPGWDNTPRRKREASIFLQSSPERYRAWLSYALSQTAGSRAAQEQFVFVNAWNEWGEGAHLEPSQRYGRAYLEATRDALLGWRSDAAGPPNFFAIPALAGKPARWQEDFSHVFSQQGPNQDGGDDALILSMAQEIRQLEMENRRLGQELGLLTGQLDELYKSKSWKLSEPLRKLKRRLMMAGSDGYSK